MANASGTLVAPIAATLVFEFGVRGGDMKALAERMHVTPEGLVDPERRVRGDLFFDAFEIAMRQTRDDSLPIACGKHVTIARCGALGYALYTSPTIADAFACLVRYNGLINSTGRWRLENAGSSAYAVWDRDEQTLGQRVANEGSLASFVSVGSELMGSTRAMKSVHVAHPAPRRTAAHEAYFSVPIRWGASQNSIELDAAVFAEKPRGGDRLLSEYFVGVVKEAQARATEHDTWASRVALAVADRLPSGLPTLESIARHLGTSERTARRRLADEGTSFAAVTEQVQRERAARLISGPHPIRDIAFATGFADVTSFCRAYKRWTGRAPSQDRASRARK